MSVSTPFMIAFVPNGMSSEGEASEVVVVCEKHEKRFLLVLYLKAPLAKGPCRKEINKTANGLQLLEDSCGGTENDDLPVIDPGFVSNGDEDGKNARVLEGTGSNSKYHQVGSSEEWSTSLQLCNDTWTWL